MWRTLMQSLSFVSVSTSDNLLRRFARMPRLIDSSSSVRGRRADAELAACIDAFRRILRELRVAARRTEKSTGLSAAQLFVLSTVAGMPGCSVNDIAARTMTDRSSAATMIDRLVDGGYLRRDQSDDDKRRASITTTSRGRTAVRKAAPAPTVLLIAGLAKLPVATRRELARGLAGLIKAMGIADQPRSMLFEDGPASARERVRRVTHR